MRKFVWFLVVALAALPVFADDLYPPSWRGLPDTTFQMWEFDNGSNPADLEAGWVNPYGTPTATIVEPIPGCDLAEWMTGYEGELGVWSLAQITPLELYIPNTENTAPETWKEIWLQITYLDPYGDGYDLPISIDTGFDSLVRVSHVQLSSGYWHDTYSMIISPNPTEETITIKPVQCALYVDEVVVDTICIPEPATVVLLSLGGLLLCRKKRA